MKHHLFSFINIYAVIFYKIKVLNQKLKNKLFMLYSIYYKKIKKIIKWKLFKLIKYLFKM